ncbi:MAG: cysteine desulfurase [Lachnospiraceae bacterium]|nr:cysteine desulfurase [Lachnospiraceae bacterium]
MECYLDNSATTKCLPEVVDAVTNCMTNVYGNPSSMHLKGVDAEKIMRSAKETIAKTLKVDEKEIFFTSGGTESDNWAVLQSARAAKRSGMHVITTHIEHAAILNPMKQLEKEGFEVTYLGTDEYGLVSVEELKSAIREDTVLVSVMGVNNEIGAVEPIAEIGECVKKCNPKTLFHVDGVQMYGKLPIYPKRMKIDMLSVSGHKIHGPKGVGILYISDKVKITPLILGGGQQKGMRSGTDNVPGIVGFAKAAEYLNSHMEDDEVRMSELRDLLIEELSKLDGVTANGPAKDDAMKEFAAPHIASISVEGVRAEVLLHALEEKGVYVSAGSACASNKPAISETLKAIGLKKELLDSTIRFSLSIFTTEEEIRYAAETLKDILDTLRKYTRR